MLVEFSMVPLGVGAHLAEALEEVLRLVDQSGVRYRLTPTGTCLEGSWGEVMDVVRRCHETLRVVSPHVMTNISIEDEEGAFDKLESNVRAMELRVGHKLENLGESQPV